MKNRGALGALCFLLTAGLLSCAADPGELKVPNVQGEEVVSSANYFTDVKVDILFVIDNSFSMDKSQARLKKGLGEFTRLFYKNKLLNFHIGVVTSDSPTLRVSTFGGGEKFVERKTPNGQDVLQTLLNVGTGGSGTEKFFSNVIDALTDPLVRGMNKGFYRQEAHLAVFFLTDTYDQSDYSSEEFIESLLALKKGDASKITLVGGIIPVALGSRPQDSSCRRDQDIVPEKIEEALLGLNGEILDICKPDFGAGLARISSEIFKSISFVKLRALPDPESIQLRFGSQIIPNAHGTGWTYDLKENKIYFGEELELKEEPQGTQLQIIFKKRVWEIKK